MFGALDPERLSGWAPGLRWIAPVSFVVATEFGYWSGWHDLRLAPPLTLVGVPLFLRARPSWVWLSPSQPSGPPSGPSG